jgi:hypothetical protein
VYLWSKWLTCCHNTGFRISLIQQPEPSGSVAGEAGEKQVRKFGRQSISLMLCRVLLHAVNLRHRTDGFTSPRKEVRAMDFYHPSSVGLEPATEYPVGSVASTLTTRPPRACTVSIIPIKPTVSSCTFPPEFYIRMRSYVCSLSINYLLMLNTLLITFRECVCGSNQLRMELN